MRKLCPNLDREDALDTILEVPIPEEMFNNMGNNLASRCQTMQQWMKAQSSDKWSSPVILGQVNELRFILHHIGSPLIPLPGLDPRAAANLFIDAVCIGEKVINNEDCFILKLETSQTTLDAQSGPKYEIIHHTLWGYFSQRSGLLLQFEDSRMLCLKNDVESEDGDGVFWETSAESVIEDYRYVDGINIAHSGKTSVRMFRYGEQSSNHQREIEETWKIDEVGFNIWGLENDFFMPPKAG